MYHRTYLLLYHEMTIVSPYSDIIGLGATAAQHYIDMVAHIVFEPNGIFSYFVPIFVRIRVPSITRTVYIL